MKVCFYFQVHQPMRLARFNIFSEDSVEPFEKYFDHELNKQIMHKVAHKCYLPANKILLDNLQRNKNMKIAFSITGVFLEQAKMYYPAVIDSFRELAATGQVEFLSETYYHSLASLMEDKEEFIQQVQLHRQTISEFSKPSNVLRNTEAMFSNSIAALAQSMGFEGIMTEGYEKILGWRSPNYVYKVAGLDRIKVLLRHYRLSDDIGYRFSLKTWNEWPLTAEKYARWLSQLQGDCVNIFMDYETFGEHHWEDTGIFNFLDHLWKEIEKYPNLELVTPSQLVAEVEPKGEIDCPEVISWADMERDTSAWLGNEMQLSAWRELKELEKPIKELNEPNLLRVWRHLQNSDHLYYCCTKSLSDQDVHNYFSHYDSPFESYINYMNIIEDLKEEVKQRLKK
ncbi:MAG: glycoside hydrolase family 57 protein [Candidatus Micrarchaeota archaeon]|nr:glycoside hydrolase family 57 protein [Candidatus Micrarchaeota archaeon]